MSDAPYIEVRGLSKIFGSDPASVLPMLGQQLTKREVLERTGHAVGLRDINLHIKRGEIFVIMGLSGSGKSTLIRHFNRLIEPSAGDIRVEGRNVMELGEAELREFRRRSMAMVFQHFGLLPHKTVLDNVGFGLKTQGVAVGERNAEAKRWLTDVGLAGYEDQYPAQLSGGQQQRVGLARALCTNADILLMDEAFSALDPLIRSDMQEQLMQLQQRLQKTIVFITHDLDEALRLGDRVAILRDGELVQVGEPQEILLNPADDYVAAFVQNVNRARALTVGHVMKPADSHLSAFTIGEVLAHMQRCKQDFAFVVDDEQFRGALRRETLERAKANAARDQDYVEEFYEDIEALSPDALLEEAIPATLTADYPLPVVDGKGRMRGLLSRSSLARIL